MPTLIENSSESSGLSLAVRLKRESAAAWRELVQLYGPLVESWARGSGLCQTSCEDIVQEVFLAVHRSIDRFDPAIEGATFRGWLWRITRNALMQLHRRAQLSPRGGSSANQLIAAVADPLGFAPEDEPPSRADETTALLHRAMEQIRSQVEPLTWEAFLRTTVAGESAAEVAESLGITPAAVRKAKSRTLQRLRKQLGDQM